MKKKISASKRKLDEKCGCENIDQLEPEMSLQTVNFAPKENSYLNEYEKEDEGE